MAMAAKPLRLKDLLELDCDSCSAAGFRCYPRHLCVAVPLPTRHEVAAEAHSVFGRSRSLHRRPSMLAIRSLSRRLWGSFSWMRRDEEAAAPVPAASISCSSDVSEASESSGSSSSSTERKSSQSSDFSSSACSAESLHAGVTTTTTDGQEHEAMKRGSTATGSGSDSDDKEQLSPVAVMDFPFHDDDEDDAIEDGASACSPSFRDSLAQLHQRRNIQLRHKIRRSRSIGEGVAAVDLGDRFASALESHDGLSIVVPVEHCCTDTDVAKAPSLQEGHRSVDDVCQYPDEHNFIALLTRSFSAVDASERLLLDFFAETRKQNCDQAAVKLAGEWIQGTGARWGLKEVLCCREDLVAEIHRGQQWSSYVVGEEIGVLVAGLVIDELVRELVDDLLL